VPVCISAVQHLRRLRGGSQSHLLRASDGAAYVTKFKNNPQHVRVLANEMLATRLGLALGLPMPRVEVIEVCEWLIARTPDLRIQLGGTEIACQSGKQLASLYVGADDPGLVSDYLPVKLLRGVCNLITFSQVLALDKWTCNSDGRQAIRWMSAVLPRHCPCFTSILPMTLRLARQTTNAWSWCFWNTLERVEGVHEAVLGPGEWIAALGLSRALWRQRAGRPFPRYLRGSSVGPLLQ